LAGKPTQAEERPDQERLEVFARGFLSQTQRETYPSLTHVLAHYQENARDGEQAIVGITWIENGKEHLHSYNVVKRSGKVALTDGQWNTWGKIFWPGPVVKVSVYPVTGGVRIPIVDDPGNWQDGAAGRKNLEHVLRVGGTGYIRGEQHSGEPAEIRVTRHGDKITWSRLDRLIGSEERPVSRDRVLTEWDHLVKNPQFKHVAPQSRPSLPTPERQYSDDLIVNWN
jgi:hypothetical protein